MTSEERAEQEEFMRNTARAAAQGQTNNMRPVVSTTATPAGGPSTSTYGYPAVSRAQAPPAISSLEDHHPQVESPIEPVVATPIFDDSSAASPQQYPPKGQQYDAPPQHAPAAAPATAANPHSSTNTVGAPASVPEVQAQPVDTFEALQVRLAALNSSTGRSNDESSA